MNINEYFKDIENKVKVAYSVAEEARKKGFDPKSKVEVPLAKSLAERVVGLISTVYPQINNKQVVNRILSLEKEYGNLEPAVCLKIAEEIAKEKFCKFQNLQEAMDAGIRVAFGYLTLGVVAAPLEGYTHFKLKKTKKGEDYIAAYFSGPIGGAGRTAASISLLIIDHLREVFGYAKYDPKDEEIKRCVTELYDFHERITNLQYLPTEEEIEFLVKHLPIQLGGDPSHDKEVSNYRDLERVETNFIRSGFCLILGEGIIQKAPKALKALKKLREQGFKLSDWDFLEEFCELQKKMRDVKKDEKAAAVYIQDLVAGRPVFGHPSRSGAFRLRYGRARNTGYSCLAIHPATMKATNGFVAVGTQLKIERPTKGCVVAACDSIDGPIVKLKNGSVKKIKDNDVDYNDIEEIIYLGDLLVPYGDFANRNSQLFPVGYVEQEWYQELNQKIQEKNTMLDIENIYDISFNSAFELSEMFGVALHPNFIYYWSQINYEEFLALLNWLQASKVNRKLILPWNKTEQERFKSGKRTLELLGVEHEVITENVILDEENSKALLLNLGLNPGFIDKENYSFDHEFIEICKEIKKLREQGLDVLDIINKLSRFEIKDKAGTFIGARMGRPEKAKLRKLVGSPNVLFPVGEEGGRLRSVNEAVEVGSIKAEFPIYFCEKCQKETIYFVCETCGEECKKLNYCKECGQKFGFDKCPEHSISQNYMSKRIDSKHYFKDAVERLNLEPEEVPSLVKGVRGTSNKNHIPENLAKGVLRSLFNLTVNKDGTIRYDATEMPITHFKPTEIGTSVEKLKSLGYKRDIYGKELHDENQILEIMPHDIILPSCVESKDEKADDVFLNISRFVDTLLSRFYGVKRFYNARSREDLIGELVACIAPHNCACVVGRIIGFSKTQGLLASPYIHAACRRDCDGDEIAIILLLDLLINFSREYLPAHRGGTQDAPLVLNARIRAGEVDDMIFDVDVVRALPLELYEAARQGESPFKVKVEQIKDRLGKKEFVDLNYEYEVSDINLGALCSSYKTLGTMQEKVQKQMELVAKIRAVDTGDVARLIIDRHFMRDIRGNLRKFSQQVFRCTKCNEKYRRPPLTGICKCGGNIIFTISYGGIVKYLEPALNLAEHYEVPEYIKQSLDLAKSYVESIFGREKEKQEAIDKWF